MLSKSADKFASNPADVGKNITSVSFRLRKNEAVHTECI